MGLANETLIDENVIKAAEAGDKESILKIADACASGVGREKDVICAWVLYHREAGLPKTDERVMKLENIINEKKRLAVETGDPEGQFIMGKCYYWGVEVEQDYKEAMRWFELAAENDVPEAQYMLWTTYYWGSRGVTTDRERAVYWLGRAAALGYKEAVLDQGHMYFYGWSGEVNYPKALEKYREAGWGEEHKMIQKVKKMIALQD